eukprot:12739057-Prorocentrum_lima.AAC.1
MRRLGTQRIGHGARAHIAWRQREEALHTVAGNPRLRHPRLALTTATLGMKWMVACLCFAAKIEANRM